MCAPYLEQYCHIQERLHRVGSVPQDRSIVDLADSCQERLESEVGTELSDDTVLYGGRSVVLRFKEIAEWQQ